MLYIVYNNIEKKNNFDIQQELQEQLAASLLEYGLVKKETEAYTESQKLTITLIKGLKKDELEKGELVFELKSSSRFILNHIETYKSQLDWSILDLKNAQRPSFNSSKQKKTPPPIKKRKVPPQQVNQPVVRKVKRKKQPQQKPKPTRMSPLSIYNATYISFEEKVETFINEIKNDPRIDSFVTKMKPLFGKYKEIKPLGIKRINKVLESNPTNCQNNREYRKILYAITEILYSMINSPVKKRCCTHFYRDNDLVIWYENKFFDAQTIIKKESMYGRFSRDIASFICFHKHNPDHPCWEDNCWKSQEIIRIVGSECQTGKFGIN